jgi:hypothetical protein
MPQTSEKLFTGEDRQGRGDDVNVIAVDKQWPKKVSYTVVARVRN